MAGCLTASSRDIKRILLTLLSPDQLWGGWGGGEDQRALLYDFILETRSLLL